MEPIFLFVTGLPTWAYIAAGAVLVVAVVLIVAATIVRARFKSALTAIASDGEDAAEAFRATYSGPTILRRSRLVERALKAAPESRLITLSGIDSLWIRRLSARGRERDFRRVLHHVGGAGLWPCFQHALRNEKRGRRFLEWLAEHESWYALREMATAAEGARFDGKAAVTLLRDYMEQVRELTGEPDWRVRLFAVRIMLEDGSRHSERGLWESTYDGESRIRVLIAAQFNPEEGDAFYDVLYDYVLHDPVFDVRKAARRRIGEAFSERYRVELEKLESYEAAHVLELLTAGSTEDQNAAMQALGGEDREQRLPAARYLLQEGVLARLLVDSALSDKERFNHNVTLLTNAASVHVSDFLYEARGKHAAGVLLAALQILGARGPVPLIADLATQAFGAVTDDEHRREVKEAALSAIHERGDERAFRVLRSNIEAARRDGDELTLLLSHVPARAEEQLRDQLFDLLLEESCPAREPLTEALLRFGPENLTATLLDIVRDSEQRHSHASRVQALHVLGRLQLPYCLSFLLEQLAFLEAEEAREFASILAETQSSDFDAQVERLLGATDAGTRAAVIAVLPAAGRSKFTKQVREALDDADPAVRSAAVWALVEFGDTRSYKQAADRLRDPVESVRVEAARALGSTGNDETIEQLRANIEDENEVVSVKEAAIIGLGAAPVQRAVDILVDALEQVPELQHTIVSSMAQMTERKPLGQLVERFKDAEPKLRELLSQAFREMGMPGERAMLELLQEQIESLVPVVVQVLEDTGAVQSNIRRLNNRDADVRREAAKTLALIGTESAFRGIVQAARDPDQDVRVEVTRALERLASEEGNEILGRLKEDPDRRVRKYTQWALERVRSKSL